MPVDLSDDAVFQNTPEWNGNLTLTYAQRVGGRLGFLIRHTERLVPRFVLTCSSSRTPLIDQTEAIRCVDASVAWTSASDKLRLALHGRNLTDEEYKIGGYYFPGAAFGNSSTASTDRRAPGS